MASVTVIGAGLAGCEVTWQLAERGIDVTLVEQKPLARTPAQTTDAFCELVCSNSLRGAALANAVGLLKEELRRAGSLILQCADATRVPAGGALAVDRDAFSAQVTARLRAHPRVTLESRVVEAIPVASPGAPVVLATGPLTGDALAADLARVVGSEHLAYYDAIAPIVAADSIEWDRVFKQSRYGKGAEDGADEAYVNCPMDEAQYRAFVAEVVGAQKVEPRSFEEVKYFEGCLPIEVMASRGAMTLAFGPMKPVGLVDPRSGRAPLRGGPAPPGRRRRHRVQPRRLPDAHDVDGAGAASSERSRASARRSSCASAAFTATRSSTRPGPSTRGCSFARAPGCFSPGRSRASKATSRAAPAASCAECSWRSRSWGCLTRPRPKPRRSAA